MTTQTNAQTTPEFQTRSQHDLKLAAGLVRQLTSNSDAAKIYGGLCHQFPVMVRTVGLAQALAFSEAKAGDKEARDRKPREIAHEKLLEHVGRILNTQGDVLSNVQNVNAAEYMHMTRRVLSAWVYFKRFAVSLLKVDSSEQAKE